MADNALLKTNQLILAKVETTYGSDPTPTAASNSLLAYDIDFTENIDPARRLGQIGSLSRLPSVTGAKFSQITFKVEDKGSGSAGTAPRIGTLFRGCSYSETVSGGVSVTYKPRSTSQESITIYYYIDGRLHKLTGAVGDCKHYSPKGAFPYWEFTFMGQFNANSTTALPTPTLESTNPQLCKSCAFSYNSKTTLVVSNVEYTTNNTVAQRPDINNANSIKGFVVTARDPKLKMTVEATVETSYDFRGDALTTQRAVTWTVGATAGNIITYTAPKFNPYMPKYGDADGLLIEEIEGEVTQNSGNDEFTIVYT